MNKSSEEEVKKEISDSGLHQFDYNLPQERIAQEPVRDRSSSKLLKYSSDTGITHHHFREITGLLPPACTLFFNNTRVIPARLLFRKETGAQIEIFLLHPVLPVKDINQAMLVTGSCVWEAMIGNLKKWKDDQELHLEFENGSQSVSIVASIENREKSWVKLSWKPENQSFAKIVEIIGKTPLPPYIQRPLNEDDPERYQTIYSKNKGAVAAPTAGLHFTENILENLTTEGHTIDYLTLHVSAGTFLPIKDPDYLKHPMHEEQIIFSRNNLKNLLQAKGKIIAVGTTSMRSLESLYWMGVKIMMKENNGFFIEKDFPYRPDLPALPSPEEAFQLVADYMDKQNVSILSGNTQIMIYPGYKFRVCKGLITNFHMPKSTLILLIAAFVGKSWKNIYESALHEDYRFLSYGDSSLLLPI